MLGMRKTGHLEWACNNKLNDFKPKEQHRSTGKIAARSFHSRSGADVNFMDRPEDSYYGAGVLPSDVVEERTDLRLHIVTADLSGYVKPYKVMVRCNGVKMRMEVDTGAAVSVISESLYWSKFKKVKLQPCNLNFQTYTDHPLELLEKINVQVQNGVQDLRLTLLVSRGKGPALMGRDWIRVLNLDWSQVNHIRDPVPWTCHRCRRVAPDPGEN